MFTTTLNEAYSVRRFVSKYSASKRTWRHTKRAAKKGQIKAL